MEKILFSMHAMLAGFTGAEEMNIDEGEAKVLSTAVAGVAAHYNVTADPKTIAWVNLASALGMIYGPRFGAIRMRKKMEKANKPAPKAAPQNNGSVVAGGIRTADAPLTGGIPGFDLTSATTAPH